MNTRTEENLGKDKKSDIYSHLQENPQCQENVNSYCFEIIDCASSDFFLKLRKQCILIGTNSNSTNKLDKYVLLSLYRSIALLLFLFLLIFFYLFIVYPFALITFYILIIYLLIFNCFSSDINIFLFFDFNFDSHLQPYTL